MLRTTDEPSTQLAEWNGCSLLCSVCSWLDRTQGRLVRAATIVAAPIKSQHFQNWHFGA